MYEKMLWQYNKEWVVLTMPSILLCGLSRTEQTSKAVQYNPFPFCRQVYMYTFSTVWFIPIMVMLFFRNGWMDERMDAWMDDGLVHG